MSSRVDFLVEPGTTVSETPADDVEIQLVPSVGEHPLPGGDGLREA